MAGYYVITMSGWRTDGRMASTSLTTFILDTIGPIHMGLHICMLYGQNSAFHVFLVPSSQCSPRGWQRSTFQISHDNWSQSLPILMKRHGCIPWSGPMVPIVLLLDTMNYVPLAAVLNLLKIDLFWFFLNSLKKFGQSIWAFLIIKLYGHYSASHVIWSLPPHPSGHPGAKKHRFLALLAKGQKSLWDGTLSVVRCPSSVVRPSVVRKQFTFSTSSLKLLGQI